MRNVRKKVVSIKDRKRKEIEPLKDSDVWKHNSTPDLIEGLVTANRISWLAGNPYAGKSWFTLYLAKCLAKGTKLFGKYETNLNGKILYLTEEPKDRISKRRNELLKEFGFSAPDILDFYFIRELQLNLTEAEDRDWLRNKIQSEGYTVLFLDSFQRATSGTESFADQVLTPIFHFFDELSETVTIIVVDHFSRQGYKIRGTVNKEANSGTQINVSKRKSTMTVTVKPKDGDEERVLKLQLNKHGILPKFELLEENQNGTKPKSTKKSKISQKEQNKFKLWQAFYPRRPRTLEAAAKSAGIDKATTTLREYAKELVKEDKLKAEYKDARGRGRIQRYTSISKIKQRKRF